MSFDWHIRFLEEKSFPTMCDTPRFEVKQLLLTKTPPDWVMIRGVSVARAVAVSLSVVVAVATTVATMVVVVVVVAVAVARAMGRAVARAVVRG